MNNSLLELLQIGGKKNYEFHLKMTDDKENVLTLDGENRVINVSIGNPEDENLPNIIEDLIDKLK